MSVIAYHPYSLEIVQISIQDNIFNASVICLKHACRELFHRYGSRKSRAKILKILQPASDSPHFFQNNLYCIQHKLKRSPELFSILVSVGNIVIQPEILQRVFILLLYAVVYEVIKIYVYMVIWIILDLKSAGICIPE